MAVDEARLGDDEYRIAYNVRNRFGDLRPTRRPLKIDGGLDSGNGAITSLTIGTGGTGYSAGNLTATDPAGNGSGFTGTYTVSSGTINTVTITAGGENYSEGTTIATSHAGDSNASVIPTTTNNKVPFQAIYAVGDFLIIAQRGAARYKHRLSDTWTTLWDSTTSNGAVIHAVDNPSLLLDTNVDYIYVQAVPGSTMNIHREATDAADSSGEVVLDYVKTGWVKTVAGLVVQDGVNQPNLIIFSSSDLGATATSRKCVAYADWDASTREYVPIGKQMMFFNGKLYVVSADGKAIYHLSLIHI